jgi:hypothetical protein
MHNDLFTRRETRRFAGLGILFLILNLAFWLALIAGGLYLLKAFDVL